MSLAQRRGGVVHGRRWTDRVNIVLLIILGVLLASFLSSMLVAQQAHTQDAINAVVTERFSSLILRIERIEQMLNWGLAALVGNIAAHVLDITGQRKRRGGG